MFFDSHCHLADKRFAQDAQNVLATARKHGVTNCGIIADSIDEAEYIVKHFSDVSGTIGTVGVHPHFADSVDARALEKIEIIAAHQYIKAIGEIGLDTVVSKTSATDQIAAFRSQALLAQKLKLPMVLHCREAFTQLFAVLDEVGYAHGVLHCFTGIERDVEEALKRGLMISYSAMITYPRNEELRKTLHTVPLDQLLIETDSPYLPPEGKRGERNEPAFVVAVAETIAEELKVPIEVIAQHTTENAKNLYLSS